ncbi:MAG: tetratricopeptide repeat protein [Candidatus Omnitrophota bacterium]|nr:tetratricopeptide repeat protein [Candidatus Omnitrophota bacterium]
MRPTQYSFPPRVRTGIFILFAVLFVSGAAVIRNDKSKSRKVLAHWPGVSYLIQERDKTVLNAQAMTLSFIQPSFDPLANFIIYHQPIDISEIRALKGYYAKAITFYPDVGEVYGMAGLASYFLEDWDEAIAHLKTATLLNPGFIWFHYNLGLTYLKTSQFALAQKSLEKAIKTNPSTNLSIVLQSRWFRQIYAPIPAFREFKIKKSLWQGYQNSYKLLILMTWEEKEFSSMLNYAESALISDIGEKDAFLYYAGRAAYELGDHAKAVDYFKKAIHENDGLGDAYYYLALSLKALGQNQEAKQLSKYPQPEEGNSFIDHDIQRISVKVF